MNINDQVAGFNGCRHVSRGRKPAKPIRTLVVGVVFLILFCGGLNAADPVPEAPPPHISGIYSPRRSILLQAGDLNRLLRVSEKLPRIPFSILTQVSDLLEVAFPEGSAVRQGPNTLVEYIPSVPPASTMGGSIIVRFSEQATLRLDNPPISGQGSIAMATVYAEGVKVFALSGKVHFRNVWVKEGEMYFFTGVVMQGPFLIDLKSLIRSSSLTIEFPGNAWLGPATARAVEKQKWMKNLGFVQPTETMLEGGGTQVRRVPVVPETPVGGPTAVETTPGGK